MTTGNDPASTTPTELSPDGSGAMFDKIAHRYDRLNRIMSLGMDRGWRKALVRAVLPDGAPEGDVLDVATGTADVALTIARTYPTRSVVGLDPSVGMLDLGRQKVSAKTLDERVELVVGDAQAMPFDDATFAGSCIAFGIRNVPDRNAGLREMRRVTAPGGVVAVLELGEPRNPFARFHVHHVVPLLGKALSSGAEYRYLQASIQAFPEPEVFAEQMTEAGLVDVKIKPMGMGSVHLYTGVVPTA